MDENKNNQPNENKADENKENEPATYTQKQLDDRIQSETDKVRTKYSNKVKELEDKIKELTPVEKSQTELDLERRLSEIEKREKRMNFLESLKDNGISSDFADYLNVDSDLTKFSEVYKKAVNNAVTQKIQESGFVPKDHKSDDVLTKEDFRKMSYEEKSKLYTTNPELYKSLSGR